MLSCSNKKIPCLVLWNRSHRQAKTWSWLWQGTENLICCIFYECLYNRYTANSSEKLTVHLQSFLGLVSYNHHTADPSENLGTFETHTDSLSCCSVWCKTVRKRGRFELLFGKGSGLKWSSEHCSLFVCLFVTLPHQTLHGSLGTHMKHCGAQCFCFCLW